ncbi:hypothetical protein [Absidia glauca]|uniref:Uncharacterized protein n=1 Tax=Absidia glauca TaxID=4829 RepID=A0A168QJC3_ABSGL|nr:hypothetical protein [Absidia glauca]
MDQEQHLIKTYPRSYSIRSDYEYLVYQPQRNHYTDIESPVTVVMKAHEGFVWNQDLFVSEHRLGKPYKSISRKAYQAKIQQACHSHRGGDDRVMDLELSTSDIDILP